MYQKNMFDRYYCIVILLLKSFGKKCFLTLKGPITAAADDNFFMQHFYWFSKNKVYYFMRIICQQMILMKYHALFVFLFLFVWFDSLRPINNLSVIKELVFLGWTNTKLWLMFLLKDTTQWHRWGSTRYPSVSRQALFHWATALLMPYLLILKSSKNLNCCLLQIIGGALRVKVHFCITHNGAQKYEDS